MIVKSRTVLWKPRMRDMEPWVQKLDRSKYILLLQGDNTRDFEYLSERQKIQQMWYDFPKDSYEWENRIDGDGERTVWTIFQTPKAALQRYLELGWNISLDNTQFTFEPDLQDNESYCLLEPAKQWLEFHQWDLKYQLDN